MEDPNDFLPIVYFFYSACPVIISKAGGCNFLQKKKILKKVRGQVKRTPPPPPFFFFWGGFGHLADGDVDI
jgi:hypothetical protein